MSQQKLENLSLTISTWSALGMAFLGIIFGIITPSDAILLDGFFSLINFIMAGATLWVAWLLKQPEGENFQFGYANFEPLINLVKGLTISVLSLFALFEAIDALLNGGRPINTGFAIFYAILAAGGCLIVALIQMKISKKINSPLVRVDAKNWLIDGVLSLAVGIGFGLVNLIKNTTFSWFINYADPTIVIILVLITFYIPIEIIISNVKIFLFASPKSADRNQIKSLFLEAISDYNCEQYWLRMTQFGRDIYLNIYFVVADNNKLNKIIEQDKIREKIAKKIAKKYPNIIVDIVFTNNRYWAIQDENNFNNTLAKKR